MDLNGEATGLFAKITQKEFRVVGRIMEKLLLLMKPANALLQADNVDIASAIEIIEHTLNEVKGLRTEASFQKTWKACKTENTTSDNQEPKMKRKRTANKRLEDYIQ